MAVLRGLGRRDLPAARAVLLAAGLADAAVVAEEKLLGPSPQGAAPAAWVALEDERPVGIASSSGRWLRLLAVEPGARARGVGRALLAAVERDVAARGEREIATLAQPGNYLSPGVDADDRATLGWLGRRGFVTREEHVNLTIALADNPRASAARAAELAAAATAAGYAIARARPDDHGLLALIATAWSPTWAYEVARALAESPPAVHVARDAAGAPVAFAAYDGNNRGLGWFGPAGTLPDHLGRGLGAAVLIACLADLGARGHRAATIAWIGPREFYERSVGVAGERRYVVLAKPLTPEPA